MKTVAERDAMRVVAAAKWVELSGMDVNGDHVFVRFTLDEARWLQAVALPTGMAEHEKLAAAADAEVPSDPPAKVQKGALPLDENGQIPGQLAIE